ncbi:hypothetical protein [Streptomyces sp. NK08204]|uniref:hypothetical protein n=1 Tax=Streptomyces sp. NK08204 TaxID=2873260 RepID=UPI001CEC318B|nr:hypothetical protein [Streptomyces sp. NK08204]
MPTIGLWATLAHVHDDLVGRPAHDLRRTGARRLSNGMRESRRDKAVPTVSWSVDLDGPVPDISVRAPGARRHPLPGTAGPPAAEAPLTVGTSTEEAV